MKRLSEIKVKKQPPCDVNAPWDRQLEKCPGSGLANCRYVGMVS